MTIYALSTSPRVLEIVIIKCWRLEDEQKN